MNKLIKKTTEAVTGAVKEIILTVAVGACLLAAVPKAQAQAGTYVNPRPYTLWSGTLTNNQSITNFAVGTNLLNYSGFHRAGLWASINFTNAAGVTGSNLVLSLDFSPGAAAGYTNSVFGTNLVYSTASPYTWTFAVATNTVLFTNLDWQNVDSVQLLKGTKLYAATTNGGPPASILFQLDLVLTP